jgi:hypothetical protein
MSDSETEEKGIIDKIKGAFTGGEKILSPERETVEKIKDRRGIIHKIQDFFTLGYGTKEDLRELNKKLRDLYYEELREQSYKWKDAYLATLEAGVTTSSTDFKKVTQVYDRVMEKVRRADYGYAGLLDRKGHIREDEMARVFNYDKGLSDEIAILNEAVARTENEVESENWEAAETNAKETKKLLLAFEDKWNDREKLFRPLEV